MIELRNLTIGYKNGNKPAVPVLKGVNSRLEKGRLTCFLGKNGAGKSTLLKTVLGVLEPIEGEILIDSVDIKKLSAKERANKISAVLTDKVSAEHISVEEFVSLGRIPHTDWLGNHTESDLEHINSAISICEIEDIREKLITKLSDGQLQKVNIARAICQDTDLILLDEPTAHLDVSNKFKVFEILRKLAIDYDKSIFIITHDMELAFQNSDMLWVIDKDNNLLSDATEDLLLNKHVLDSFMSESFKFDYTSGKFLYKHTARVSFELSGEVESVYWTKQALYKNGYGVKSDSEFSINAVQGNKTWEINKGSEALFSASTIKDLIIGLNKYFYPQYSNPK